MFIRSLYCWYGGVLFRRARSICLRGWRGGALHGDVDHQGQRCGGAGLHEYGVERHDVFKDFSGSFVDLLKSVFVVALPPCGLMVGLLAFHPLACWCIISTDVGN